MFHLLSFRWNVAIKTVRRPEGSRVCAGIKYFKVYEGDRELPLLLEEAKTMWRVGGYHENIVNLQGITAREKNGSLTQVGIYHRQGGTSL